MTTVPPAADPARTAIRTLSDRVDTLAEALRVRVDATRTATAAAVDRFAAVHRAAAATASGADGDEEARAAWERAVRYRDTVLAEGLRPLIDEIRRDAYPASLTQALDDAHIALRTAADGLPLTVAVPHTPEIYDPDPTDSRWRSWRKARARAALIDRSATTRTIPSGPRWRYHAEHRVADLLTAYVTRTRHALDTAQARLEAACDDWTHAVLTLEQGLDRAAFHQPAELPYEPVAIPPDSDAPPLDPVVVDLDTALRSIGDALRAAPEEPALAEATAALTSDVERFDTFVLPVGQRTTPSRPSDARNRAEWAAWHAETLNRLELDVHLIGLRQNLDRVEAQLVGRVTDAALRPLFATFETLTSGLRTALDEAEAACDAVRTGGPPGTLARALRVVQRDCLNRVRRALRDAPGLAPAAAVLEPPGVEAWAALQGIIADLPTDLSVHVPGPTSAAEATRRLTVDLRDAAADAIAPPLPTRLAALGSALQRRLGTVWNEVERVTDIIEYNMGAALDELERTDTGEYPIPSAGDDDPSPEAAARELTLDALRRSAEVIEDLGETVWPEWQAFADGAFAAFAGDWVALHRRVQAEHRVAEQWMGLYTRTSRTFETWWRRGRDGARHLGAWLAQRGRSLARQVTRLIRRGRSAVAAPTSVVDEHVEAIAAITNIDARVAELPLVYRKLFSLDPIRDPSLLEGRARDLVGVRAHYQRWSSGDPASVLILVSPLGTGRTSFLNALEETVFDGAVVHRIHLPTRLDAAGLAARLGQALAVDLGGAPTVDGLERALIDRAPLPRPTVVLIDDLEHLLLQVPGGLDALEQVFAMMCRTDSVVYWAATVGREAWRFIEATARAASGLVTTLPLAPFDADTVASVLLNRHRRTGLGLAFDPPDAPSPLLRQRLRRARTPDRRQQVLRDSYMEAMYRAGGQHLKLALFYWLRSITVATDVDTVRVAPLRALDFRFLNALDLTRALTLKALVLHKTLTVAEHARLFRLPGHRSTFVLESLLNLRLIDTTDPAGGARVVPEARYRIRPLLLHPVLESLRERRIVY